MNKVYDSDEELFADIEKAIDDTLANEVLNKVKEIEIKHIQDDVFDVYNPKIYERRTTSGIDDENNIVGNVKKGELEVENVTEFNPGYGTSNHGVGLADLINDGNGTMGHIYDYAYGSRDYYSYPRPFIDNTIEELDKSNDCENALMDGLKKRGIDIG